ncbi:MAG TPA: LssY C-terminal domain-containing protein [Terriglobales bacterium]|nr:LssY C-terminal domain-containing protein [Terriglobales bacterium]
MNCILRISRVALRMPPSAVRFLPGALLLVLSTTLLSCGPNQPDPSGVPGFTDRALSQEKDGVVVRVAVPTPAESRRFFGAATDSVEVQPLWLRIENNTDVFLRYLPIVTDPTYFAPLEVAHRLHGWFSSSTNDAIDAVCERNAILNFIPAHQSVSGFVYTHRDAGLKFVNVGLVGGGQVHLFRFIVPITGVQYQVQSVDFHKLYPAGEIEDLNLADLRKKLEGLPCCVTNKNGSAKGDPLNLVIVSDGVDGIFPFTQRGWQLNEPVSAGSSFRMAKAFVLGSQYDTAPVSPLYLFGRYQDLALQKARATVSQRNHMRLWMAPFTVEGEKVWIGQISRDIGIKLTTKAWSLTTHRIGPYVDQERDYLLQDLLLTGFVDRVGYVKGVGESIPEQPRKNLTDDPYYTDGLRVVIFLGSKLRSPTQIEGLEWERPLAAH